MLWCCWMMCTLYPLTPFLSSSSMNKSCMWRPGWRKSPDWPVQKKCLKFLFFLITLTQNVVLTGNKRNVCYFALEINSVKLWRGFLISDFCLSSAMIMTFVWCESFWKNSSFKVNITVGCHLTINTLLCLLVVCLFSYGNDLLNLKLCVQLVLNVKHSVRSRCDHPPLVAQRCTLIILEERNSYFRIIKCHYANGLNWSFKDVDVILSFLLFYHFHCDAALTVIILQPSK